MKNVLPVFLMLAISAVSSGPDEVHSIEFYGTK